MSTTTPVRDRSDLRAARTASGDRIHLTLTDTNRRRTLCGRPVVGLVDAGPHAKHPTQLASCRRCTHWTDR